MLIGISLTTILRTWPYTIVLDIASLFDPLVSKTAKKSFDEYVYEESIYIIYTISSFKRSRKRCNTPAVDQAAPDITKMYVY